MTYEEFKQKFLPELMNINSFAGKINYANQYLQRIGSGSGRIVYDIDGNKVLKLAKNAKGIAQNEAEAGAGYYRDTQHIVAEIFDNDDNYSFIIAEKAKKVTEKRIKELTEIPSLWELFYFLKNQVDQNNGKRKMYRQDKELEDFFWENEFSRDLIDFVVSYNQTVGDMGRPSTYGEVLRDGKPTIILTDYGLNDEAYSSYYSPERKQKYRMYELFNYADGNDDILSDTGDPGDIRRGIWGYVPYSVSDGSGVFNEEFNNFVLNRNKYPDKPISGLPTLTDNFHECINNLKETLNNVKNKKQFYNNLLELQNYLIKRGFYDREPLLNEEEIPNVKSFSLNDENYANELAKNVAGKLNLNTPQLIGGGGYGFAYKINDNLIMKITSDVSEADAASKLIRGNPKYIAKIFNLYKVVDNETNNAYFIIMQENVADKPIEKFRNIENSINMVQPLGLDYIRLLTKIKIPSRFNYDEMVNVAKHILTDNPEANIDKLERQEAYDFFIGILNIRKELLEYGIKSVDYIENKNLGYNDGVLKFFDTGGYFGVTEPVIDNSNIIKLPETKKNVNESYDRETADLIANNIASKMNLPQPQYIESGMFGVAYDIGNDKVLKITKDKSEAAENLMLINKPLKYIAEPYNVFEIKSKSNPELLPTYAIILEKLKTTPEINRLYDRLNFAFNKIMGVKIPDVIEYYLGEWDDGKVSKEKINSYLKNNPQDAEFFNGLVKIAEETKALGIESMDYLNPDNLGYKKNGALGFFDVGFGNYFLEPKGTEKLEVQEDGSAKFTTMDAINQDGFPPYNTNDTSPSINNNLNANISLYEDLEYNHVIGGANNNEYEISEDRKKSWVKGSQAVNVKKKCRLGGLGNTSVACNQGDVNNLEFSSLNEVGEGNLESYPVEIERSDNSVKIYKFKTEDNDDYFLEFVNTGYDENFWRVDFGIENIDDPTKIYTDIINKGRMYKVMATILKVIRGFFANTKPDILVIEPTKTKNKFDDRRFSLYLSYIEKNIPQEYEMTRDNKEILIKKKNIDINEYYSSLVPTINENNKWNINGEDVNIDFFVKKYDEWNHQGGTAGYSDPSEYSVLEFLQNNYEDFSNDEKLKKELYLALNDEELLKENKENQIEYGALMLFLNIPLWKKITSIIKKEDIYEKNGEFGIETEPHVTILYGFHDNVNADEVFNLYKENFKLKPIEINVNGISIFENDDYDVVKMDVNSEILSKMNSIMRKLPNTTDYPKYHAHITLAYVKKGHGKKYIKKFNKNYKIIGNELVFSTKKEKRNRIKLNEKGILKENI